ncbi:MAG: urease accessory protein UreD, partial [Candidatus Poribacteria bacterium]|nr:urease accessory protein UreD [Candidatus Poribacteria bacterium]
FQFTRYRSRLRVSDGRGLVVYEANDLNPQRDNLLALATLEGYACWGSWCWVGVTVGDDATWRALAEKVEPLLNVEGHSIGGVSRLHRNGIAARMLAHRATPIQRAFHDVWDLLKRELTGSGVVPIRKY